MTMLYIILGQRVNFVIIRKMVPQRIAPVVTIRPIVGGSLLGIINVPGKREPMTRKENV